MGEVYRARDTKLNRDVALKVLPEAFAVDPDRLARYRREAQVLASLNHPNIAAIYGLEEANGIDAVVMELVEGSTEALPIAKQMAEALSTLVLRRRSNQVEIGYRRAPVRDSNHTIKVCG
jgi:serine/threonine protein kinase